MILSDSSSARVGASVVSAALSIVGAIRNFFVYTDFLFSSALSGAVDLIKVGTGTLTLSGNNTYSGTTKINTGVLSIADLTSLPGWNTNGRYSVEAGATLAVYNAVTDANVATILGTTNFKANSAIGFDTTSGARTYPNVIANTAQGVLGLTKLGANTLTISGANTYTGPTLVIAGTLATSTSNKIPDASAVTILSGAAITLGGSETFATLAGAGTLTCGANSLTLNSTNSATFSGTLTNTAGIFFKSGTGVQTLSGSTTVAAQVRLDGGGIVSSGTFLQTAAASSRNFQIAINGGTTAALTVSGGTMTVTGLFFGENNGGSATVNVNAGTLQVNGETWQAGLLSTLNVNGGVFITSGSFDIGGGAGTTTSIVNVISGSMTLGPFLRWGIGSATATSVINLDGGTLASGNWVRNGGTNTFNFNGGTFTINSNITITQPLISCVVKSGGAVFSVPSGLTLAFDTVLATGGTGGGLRKIGSGILTLTQNNTYTGATQVEAGTLQISGGSLAGPVVVTGLLSFNRSDTSTFSNVISGAGSLIKQGSGTLTLSGVNTYTGVTSISAGILQMGDSAAFGSGDIVFTGGTLRFIAGYVFDISARIKNSSSAIRIDTNGQNATFTSLASTNTGGLIKSGSGTLAFTGSSNAFTGNITCSAGATQFLGPYTATGTVFVNGTTPTLSIASTFTQTYTASSVRSFQVALTNGSSATVNVEGSANVTLNAGMMLGDNNGGNGTFNQTGGTVSTGAGGTWLAGAVCLLDVSGGTFTTVGIECGGGTGAGTVTVSGAGTINAGSLIINRGSGAGVSAVININGGTLTTTGVTHVTAARPATINFNGGIFSSLNTLSIAATIVSVVKSGGAVFNVSGALTVNSALTDGAGGGGLTKQGLGTLVLNGINTYTGATAISAGLIRVAKAVGGITGTATYSTTALTVDFANVTPTSGAAYRFFPGSTATTGLTISLTNAGGKTGTYDYSNSTLTIV